MKIMFIALIAIVAVSCTNPVKVITDTGIIYQINDLEGYSDYTDSVVVRFANGNPEIYSVYKGSVPEMSYYTAYDSSLVIIRYEKAVIIKPQ